MLESRTQGSVLLSNVCIGFLLTKRLNFGKHRSFVVHKITYEIYLQKQFPRFFHSPNKGTADIKRYRRFCTSEIILFPFVPKENSNLKIQTTTLSSIIKEMLRSIVFAYVFVFYLITELERWFNRVINVVFYLFIVYPYSFEIGSAVSKINVADTFGFHLFVRIYIGYL